ncbi:uncharacterized protein LOC126671250 [Mercurialis annua]|uniref:uncharacterized protein LOC126671250 n=1 Tax=Mercurialis annua TaxID=3986 RepID=UPI00215FC6E3|nr:uncharacterized protein LOC126671250 [Mercurialis annua]
MTMVPAQTLSEHQQEQHHSLFYGGYGGFGGGGGGSYNSQSFGVMSRLEEGYDYCISDTNCLLGSDLVLRAANNNNLMAEDESRTNSFNEAAGSSSKDQNHNHENITTNNKNKDNDQEEDWLQLSIGGGGGNTTPSSANQRKFQEMDPTAGGRGGGLVELDLLQGGGFSAPNFQVPSARSQVMNLAAGSTNFTTSVFFQRPAGSSSLMYPHHNNQEINWAFRNVPYNIATAPSSSSSPNSQSSSSSLMPPLGSYFSRPFQVHSGAGPSSSTVSDFRVIDPPRRPHSGIWFTLQASLNQTQEPLLPQISKSYLRIKDGRMTVRLLMKYLVNKLRLDSESEVEIRCRGEELQPLLTLQHVRDNIWSRRDSVSLVPDSSTIDHIMVLHYARTSQK